MKSQMTKSSPSEVLGTQRKKQERRQNRHAWVRYVGGAAVLAFIMVRVLLGIAVVRGTSMTPAYLGNEVVIFRRIINKYESGDIVVIKTDDKDNVIKRVVGVPGDEIQIDDQTGELLVNGVVRQESYIYERTEPKEGNEYPLVLKKDEYFVLGDHRENSKDSRNYGPVGKKKIQGKVILSVRKE